MSLHRVRPAGHRPKPRTPGLYVAGASASIALSAGAIDLLQGAGWPAVATLVGLTFATSAAPILALCDREGA